MATELGICNSALIKLGVEVITSLAQNNRQAKLCNEQYSKIRDDLLTSHPWNFAMKRVALTATVTAPEFEFAYEYTLPADCLRVWQAEHADTFYQVEGDKLYTNETPMKIRYISKVTDPAKFTPTFAEALSLMLAADLAYPLVQSNSLKNTLLGELQVKLRDVRSFDAQENPSYPLADDVWLNSRY